jgi:hypothetical protein
MGRNNGIGNVKKLRHLDVRKIRAEIATIENLVGNTREVGARFHSHKAEIDGDGFVAFDAKSVNHQTNQGGRGDFRYLFQQGRYVALAEHLASGDYRILAYGV